MRNAVSNKGEPRKILGGKNLTVARATFATVWILACLGLCDVKDIEQEIEESAEVVSRILTAKRKLENALKPGISKVINEKNNVQSSQLSPNQK